MSSSGLRIGVLGSGSGTNCEAIIEACERGEIPGQVVVVLSDIADAKILERARKHSIPAKFIGPSRFRATRRNRCTSGFRWWNIGCIRRRFGCLPRVN